MKTCDFESDTDIHFIALSDPVITSTESSPLDSLSPFCPNTSSSHSLFEALLHFSLLQLKIGCRSLPVLASTTSLFTYSGFYFTFLSRRPKTNSSLKPWGIFGYLQLSPTYPQSCFKRRITFSTKFFLLEHLI